MDDFEEKYNEYIKKLKDEIPYVLWKEHHDLKYNFERNFIQGNSFLSIMAILWWVCGIIGSLVTEHRVLPHIIFFVVWLGIGIWYSIFNSRHTEDIAYYFFYKYEYKKIIEDRIKRDEQQEIQNLLDKMFDKDNLNFADLDMYKFKLEDIKCFYDQCLREIKYEHFEEKIR